MSIEIETHPATSGPVVARVAKAIGIAPEGVAISSAVAIVGLILIIAGIPAVGAVVVILALAVGAFFRDPSRFPKRTEGVVISGADGKVSDVAEATFPGAPDRPCRRVSVFMSPLNVHVNRAPVAGSVERVEYTPGKFRAAFRDVASEHNERNLLVFADLFGRHIAMTQVAGYLARRIVCRVRARDRIEIAERVGLIMFGSRVDHFLPPEFRVTVARGDRVRAGESIIGELQDEPTAASPHAN